MSITYVKASCHCGLNAFQIPLLNSTLPQAADMCHCDTCRHITGQMFVHCAMIEGPPLAVDSGTTPETHKPADLSKLTKYQASDKVIRYFCPKCSAYLLYDIRFTATPFWAVSSGAMERTEGLVKVGYHMFVGDTLDGGVADHYLHLNGKELPRYEGWEGSKQLSLGWKSDNLASLIAKGEDRLNAYCHCKAISIYLTRPKQEDAKDAAKWWLIPANEDDPNSKPRYVAGHCFCNSCRLTSGSLFVSHLIAPRANMFDAHTDLPIMLAIPKDGSTNPNRPKDLVQYPSSPGVFRESCGRCGASVFFWSKKAEGGFFPVHEGDETAVLDVHMGLIDEQAGGARSEGWVSFHEKIIHGEDAVDKATAEAVQASIKPNQVSSS
ncbi:Mss4-like protein [Crepidotus variabilis]|uniref:Mss4-like protein n=1 Tax=Crepidotus variabilis TaxID=179855 RepID=A0A9P6EPU9_9AGAR|nr:Mss4-like protein [Crepidotus variabilis]